MTKVIRKLLVGEEGGENCIISLVKKFIVPNVAHCFDSLKGSFNEARNV